MQHSKLSEHILKKGKFITPLHAIPNMVEFEDEKSWCYGRLPEYLWIGLILKYFGRSEGLAKLKNIIFKLHKLAPDLLTPRMSQILNLDKEIQKKFFMYIVNMGCKEVLAPLTVYITVSIGPIFANIFYCSNQSIEFRCEKIVAAMNDIMDHQSYESTDIRFVVTYFSLLSGNINMRKEEVDLLSKYPLCSHDDEIMKMIRPLVRSLEGLLLDLKEVVDKSYLENFWRCISEMTDCDVFIIKYHSENRDITEYIDSVYNALKYLSKVYISVEPLNEKMKVILGMATYSYKRFKELNDHNLFNAISGRSCVRVLAEVYIMMKYLVCNETKNENIWKEYQFYGTGLYKLVLERYRESETEVETHFDKDYIEALVNEYKYEAFIDMDTRYFDKQNIREKANIVGEKELYGLYYDYDSSYEHGLWGAIRESSLLKCDNPAHKFHCIPDLDDEIVLKTVLPDCIMIMNKIILLLDDIYGIPDDLLKGVTDFEIMPLK